MSPDTRADPVAARSPAELARLRRRTVGVLGLNVALGTTGHIAVITVGSLAAAELSGSKALSGLPGSLAVAGTAVGAMIVSWVMSRRGRRFGLTLGYLVGAVGATVAAGAIGAGAFGGLLAGTLLIGFANGSAQQSRYTAADLYPPARRATTVGIVVWAATVGAVLGPNLAEPLGRLASARGLPELGGPYLFQVGLYLVTALIAFALLRPDPYEIADRSAFEAEEAPVAASVREIIRRPRVTAAIVALVVGQAVMTLIMTMTPLHMRDHGQPLEAVGLVLSGHTFGMFALSPISGRMTTRFGPVRVIFLGTAILALSGILSAVAPPAGGALLFTALFLLGWGWNLGFVAGSTLLSGGITLAERTRIQGLADGTIWSAAAVAGISSGVVLELVGFASLGLLGAALVLLPVWVLAARRSAIAAAD